MGETIKIERKPSQKTGSGSAFLLQLPAAEPLQSLRERAISEITEKMKGEKGIVGVYLFGSLGRGNASASSDIDICAVFEEGAECKDRISVNDLEVTIVRRPIGNINYIFNANMDWALEQLQNCKILFDPKGLLKKVIDYAKSVQISKERIIESVTLSVEALESAEDLENEKNLVGAQLCVQYALLKAARAYLNVIGNTYRGPKYVAQQLKDSDCEVYRSFLEVMAAEGEKGLDTLAAEVNAINQKTIALLKKREEGEMGVCLN